MVTGLVYPVRFSELPLPASEPDPPAHDVKREDNQRKDENQDLQRAGGDVHDGLIGMTLCDFRRTSPESAQYNARIPQQLYGF
jgi:hypothetical protein